MSEPTQTSNQVENTERHPTFTDVECVGGVCRLPRPRTPNCCPCPRPNSGSDCLAEVESESSSTTTSTNTPDRWGAFFALVELQTQLVETHSELVRAYHSLLDSESSEDEEEDDTQ